MITGRAERKMSAEVSETWLLGLSCVPILMQHRQARRFPLESVVGSCQAVSDAMGGVNFYRASRNGGHLSNVKSGSSLLRLLRVLIEN